MYGGDPDNVTIFGESAGGGSVLGLLAAPQADSLYHKAITHSPTPISLPPKDNVAAFARAFDATGAALKTKLHTATVAELLGLRESVGFNVGRVDGTVITRTTRQAIAERAAAGVPLIAGSNRDEGTFFTTLLPESI